VELLLTAFELVKLHPQHVIRFASLVVTVMTTNTKTLQYQGRIVIDEQDC
jgi:hypothetical protein